jgi:hypothetical protein
MFQRWLNRQQPLWLVGTFFLVAVAVEMQAPYHKKVKSVQVENRGDIRETGVEGSSIEVVEKSP